MDGAGYPDGLAGDEVPLGARIIAVADSFDAMTSNRAYRRAMSHDAAIDELCRCADTQFDPDVVHAFIELLQQDAGPSVQAPQEALSPIA
jgi:HD-GYP domain-containing protein (c-di-GMP phosphodiesterase class II)